MTSRQDLLDAIASAHYEWESRHLPGATMTPRPDGKVYNLHYLDVDGASPDQEAEFHRMVASSIGPVTKSAPDVVAAGLAVRAKDTGRVLMIQRAHDEDDPAGGFWEFPGGRLDDGEEPEDAARREWTEETGLAVPDGRIVATWRDGVYEGHVLPVESESVVDLLGRDVENPDDPDNDHPEAIAWWNPAELKDNEAIRPELRKHPKRVRRALESAGDDIGKSFRAGPLAHSPVIRIKSDTGRAVYDQLLQNYPPDSIEWVRRATWSGPHEVPWDEIDHDDMDKWAASHEPARVDEFARRIEAGDEPHPVVLVVDPDGNYIDVDGHHRALAYRKLGRLIPAWVGEISPDDRHAMEETHLDQVHEGTSPLNKSVANKASEGGHHVAGTPYTYRHGWIRLVPGECKDGCGAKTKGGHYLPGHDARHLSDLHGAVTRGEITHEEAHQALSHSGKLQAKLAKRLGRPLPQGAAEIRPEIKPEVRPETGGYCKDGCGGRPRSGHYLPGHDSKHLARLHDEIKRGETTPDAALQEVGHSGKLQDKLRDRLARSGHLEEVKLPKETADDRVKPQTGEIPEGFSIVRTRRGFAVRMEGSPAYVHEGTKASSEEYLRNLVRQRAGLQQAEDEKKSREDAWLQEHGIGPVDFRDLKPGDRYTTKPYGPIHEVTQVKHMDNGSSMVYHDLTPVERAAHDTPFTLFTPGSKAYGSHAASQAEDRPEFTPTQTGRTTISLPHLDAADKNRVLDEQVFSHYPAGGLNEVQRTPGALGDTEHVPISSVHLSMQDLDESTVSKYASQLSAGNDPGASIAVRDGDRVVIVDGNHRAEARARSGETTIPVRFVKPKSPEDTAGGYHRALFDNLNRFLGPNDLTSSDAQAKLDDTLRSSTEEDLKGLVRTSHVLRDTHRHALNIGHAATEELARRNNVQAEYDRIFSGPSVAKDLAKLKEPALQDLRDEASARGHTARYHVIGDVLRSKREAADRKRSRDAAKLQATRSAITVLSGRESRSSRVQMLNDRQLSDIDKHMSGPGKLDGYDNPEVHQAVKDEIARRAEATRQAAKLGRIGKEFGWQLEHDGSAQADEHMQQLNDHMPTAFARQLKKFGTRQHLAETTIGEAARKNGWPGWTGSPRGWSPGSTWDQVGGVYSPSTRRAFSGDNKNSGSVSTVLHESSHALDHAMGYPSTSSRYEKIYDRIAGLARLMPYYGEQDDKKANLSEFWAETLAAWQESSPVARRDAMLDAVSYGRKDGADWDQVDKAFGDLDSYYQTLLAQLERKHGGD